MTVKTLDEISDFEFKITVKFLKELHKLIKLFTNSAQQDINFPIPKKTQQISSKQI